MPDRRRHWEERYAERERPPGHPSEFVEAALRRFRPDGPAGTGRALDVACGDGRHALALARRGWTVTSVDLARAALLRLQIAARGEALPVHPVQADLERFPLPVDRYDVVIDTFYLQRDLFGPLQSSLSVGGLAVVETFLVDQRDIGHPRNAAFLLERGELRQRFAHFEILSYEEGLVDNGGERAYLARLAACRPARRDRD